jgi:hypothetical protein
MNLGDTIEAAIWMDGTETPEHRRAFEQDASAAMANAQNEAGVMIGPIQFVEKRLGEDRVPSVPDHIQGPDVRLLVASAVVVGYLPALPPGRFTDDLDPDDLARLRTITRDAYSGQFPRRWPLTNRQCDTLINDLGLDAALDTLRGGEVDIAKMLN